MNLTTKFSGKELSDVLHQIKTDNLMWFAKRLSGNDTNLTGGHQVGIYIPRNVVQLLCPEINNTKQLNPDKYIEQTLFINSDFVPQEKLRMTYYNNRFTSVNGSRNEFRITKWGGKNCPVQDPERTGSILLFIWQKEDDNIYSAIWVTQSSIEEDLIEGWVGENILPGEFFLPYSRSLKNDKQKVNFADIPSEWNKNFPTGKDVYDYIYNIADHNLMAVDPDKALVWGREVEFKLFKILEENIVGPAIANQTLTVEKLVSFANIITNRRKSRSGRSLELHLAGIFNANAIQYEEQAITENRKKPDFLFPSKKAYHNPYYPVEGLHMLAAKSCCKDRWRQVINEANRIEKKTSIYTPGRSFCTPDGRNGNRRNMFSCS